MKDIKSDKIKQYKKLMKGINFLSARQKEKSLKGNLNNSFWCKKPQNNSLLLRSQ